MQTERRGECELRHVFGVTVPILVLCGLFACDGRDSSVATQQMASVSSSLPDPIVQRLGGDRARELHIAGSRQHILNVRREFGFYIDVCSQCDAADAFISDSVSPLSQRPLILCAGSVEGEKARLHISGINIRRETDVVVFAFSIHDVNYSVSYLRGIAVKDEEMTLALPPLDLRFVSPREMEELVTEVVGGVRTLVVQSEQARNSNPEIPLPTDVPVYVSVWDRSGLKSDAMPFHRNLLRREVR